jgi:predicted secreted hydrolase
VALGLERSGRIITSAAAIVILVSSAFVSAEMVIVKALGVGMALAVLLDATVVRGLLVPATMRLLGDLNWWWPRRLARLLPLSLALLLLAGCALPGTIAEEGYLPTVGPAPTPTALPAMRFPEDEAPHRYLTEWWYYTGHLHGADAAGRSHDYGFELTFFQTLRGRLPPYFAAHYAVSDLTLGEFHYAERSGFEPAASLPLEGTRSGFDLALGGWTARGLAGQDRLTASMDGYAVDLALTDQLPHPVLHGGDGLIGYGDAGFSYYYSRPLLAVSGTVLDHGEPVKVEGRAWMDHQWGNFVSLAGSGWDWLSVQLDDRTEYMLYVIRDDRKQPLSVVGTVVAPDGQATDLPATDIRIEAIGTWTSPKTGGVYPAGWKVTVPSRDLALTLTPALADQELVTTQSTGVAYWEGAVRVAGQASGRAVLGEGYVELTGYAPSS